MLCLLHVGHLRISAVRPGSIALGNTAVLCTLASSRRVLCESCFVGQHHECFISVLSSTNRTSSCLWLRTCCLAASAFVWKIRNRSKSRGARNRRLAWLGGLHTRLTLVSLVLMWVSACVYDTVHALPHQPQASSGLLAARIRLCLRQFLSIELWVAEPCVM